MRIIRDRHHVRARSRGGLDVREVVADVVRDRGEDAVAAFEPEPVEGHVPGAGRARGERDFLSACPDQLGDRAVEAVDRLLVRGMRRVAAEASLELEMRDDSVQYGLRRQ